MKNSFRFICGACLILAAASRAYGQQPLLQHPESRVDRSWGNSGFIDYKPGHIYSILTNAEGKTEINEINLMGALDIIVEFKEEPWLVRKTGTSAHFAGAASYQRWFSQFDADLAGIQQKISHQISVTTISAQPHIKRIYYKIFFGASLSIPRMALSYVQNLDYVKRIHLDERVEATLSESVPLIQADKVWSQLGSQGDGIVIGIIDTGIDYRHPALGAGLGPGFKVIGGYDFVNEDNDPLDDNGHGTHVAGIVAANSDGLRGVAPRALLMAFKALDSGGTGLTSDVIAAIERTVDPNDDGDISDKADVVNMSLGGSGHPDDAASTAVDNAVQLGITFCISAGNRGDFRTIGSPGTARSAITVGASDKADKLASFSSKGPNHKIYSIKPEVLAPGVGINSAALINGATQLNGTSMAAPHTAGVCALLKALHPNWSPLQIKSALMTTAVNIGEEVMAQGAGRIDALKAAQVALAIFPPLLSFGLADVSQTVWNVSKSLKIVNQSSLPQNVVISADGEQAGIEVTASPANFSLAAGDSQEVVIALRVDNPAVPFPEQGSLAYSGVLHVNAGMDNLRVPWAFVKASRVFLASDKPITSFMIANNDFSVGPEQAVTFDPSTVELAVPKGVYDLVVHLEDHESGPAFILKENLAVEGIVNISAQSTEAVHTLEWRGVDENGRPLASLENSQMALNVILPGTLQNPVNVDFVYEALQPSLLLKTMRISPVSDRILLWTTEFQYETDGENIVRVLHYEPVRGIDKDLVVENAPSDFVMEHIDFNLPSSIDPSTLGLRASRKFRTTQGISSLASLVLANFQVASGHWQGKLYLTPESHSNFKYPVGFFATNPKIPQGGPKASLLITQDFFASNGRVGSFSLITEPEEVVYLADQDTMRFGAAPIFGSLTTFNSSSRIFGFVDFRGALAESRTRDGYLSRYEIYNDQNVLVAADTLHLDPISMTLASGQYRVEVINPNFSVGNIPGRAVLTSEFRLNSTRRDPPYISFMALLNKDDKPVENLRADELVGLPNQTASLQVIVQRSHAYFSDPAITRPVRLYYKKYGTTDWREITHSTSNRLGQQAGGFKVEFFLASSDLHTMDSSAIDLRIAMDGENLLSSSELTLEPAFTIGNFGGIVSVDQPGRLEYVAPKKFALYANYPNPFNPSTVFIFDLPVKREVSLKIFDVLGREVRTLVNASFESGRHRIVWDGAGNHGRVVASGVYFYRINTGEFTATKKMLLVR